eukprot:TRINITY_DN18632_c0_g1_i2.p1 TRINITY_DN18632_c0_g1~~TRINITY_DN18632_c0_g1_i2.p1  ORF type:complete len:266 (+),score=71.58 TRINITY_DN18632_c0_g1_i2:73-870(+)
MCARFAAALLAAAPGRGAFSAEGERCTLEVTGAPVAAPEADRLLEAAFDGISGFDPLAPEEHARIDGAARGTADSDRCPASTYLELPVDDVFAHPSFRVSRGSSLADLGAGVGKPPLRAVLAHGAAEGVGVELSRQRWQAGCAALERLGGLLRAAPQLEAGGPRRRVTLIRGDLLSADVSATTHVVAFATCFPSAVVSRLQRKLLEEMPVGGLIFVAGHGGFWDPTLYIRGRYMRQLGAAAGSRGGEDDILRRIWRVSTEADDTL